MLNTKDVDFSVVDDELMDVMKPTRKEYHIMKTRTKALRKYKILRDYYGFQKNYDSRIEHGKEIGRLNFGLKHYGFLRKGKIHCSCNMCKAKTKNAGYKISDQKKLDKLNYQD